MVLQVSRISDNDALFGNRSWQNKVRTGGGKIREKDHGLLDYKFFCFNGKVEFLYVMGDRSVGDKVSVSIYDKDFHRIDVKRVGDQLLLDVRRPDNFDELRDIAEQLAKDFPHVRVDLYDCENKVYFGEMTFYNASGYMRYEPDEFDYTLGIKFKLPRIRTC